MTMRLLKTSAITTGACVLAATATFFGTLPAIGAEPVAPPSVAMGTIHVAHTLQAPSLDGDAGDAAWTNAPWTSAFRLLAHPEVEAAGQTRARFVHDGSSLFVCVEAEVPDASTLTLKSTNVHDAPLWKDDCIEIHLDPGATESHFFQIIVNWKGTVYDAYGEDDNKGAGTFSMRPEWDARAETAVRIADGLWTTELKIPFASLRLAPGAKATWGVNVARARFSPKPEFSTWSPLDPTRGFGQPTRYRRMELASFDPAPFWWSCLPPAVQSTWSGTQTVCRVEAVLVNETGRERQADVVLDFAGERRVARETFAPDAKRKVAFDVPVQKMGRHRLRLRLTDAGDPAATRFDWQVEAEVDDQPLRLEMLKPAYRDCLFASQKTPRIEARLHCDPALVGRPIAIRLQGEGVQTEPKTFAAAAARQDFAFPMEDHPDGTYEMVVEMPGVKPLVRQIRKLPPLEGEAWLDARGNLHVDGKPFFPFGWYMGPLDREPGMNVVLRYGVPDTNYLDKARVGGKKVIAMPYPFTSDLFKHTKMQGTLTDAQAAEITAVVEQSRHHPALLAYYLVDEPEGTNVSLEWLQAAYKLISTLDPHHPILITNYGLRGIQAYYSACDILMPDCYPVFLAKGGTRYPISNLRKWTETARALRPTWMVPQFFDWDGVSPVVDPARAPTFDELRNNVWQSLAAGARGIVGFHYTWDGRGYSMALRHGPDYLAREVETLLPALYGEPRPDDVAVAVSPPDPTFTTALLRFGDDVLLIAVNNAYETRRARFTLAAPTFQTLHVVGENRAVALDGHAFEDAFAPTATHLYTTRADLARTLDLHALREAMAAADRARVKPGNLVGLGDMTRDALERLAQDRPAGAPQVAVSSQHNLYHARNRSWLVYYLLDGLSEDVTHCTWSPRHDDKQPWVEVTLPRPGPVGRVVLYSPLDAKGKAKLNAGRVVVRTADGENVPVATFAKNEAHRLDLVFPAVEGTAVRIEPTTFSTGWGKVDFGLLTELEVYGPDPK